MSTVVVVRKNGGTTLVNQPQRTAAFVVRGVPGPPGPAGERGTKWFTGSGAPGVITGSALGDIYLDIADGTVYVLN